MSSFKDRLILAEDDFLMALTEGDSALTAFNERWEQLMHELSYAADSGLDPETSQLAHTTALRISTLADTSIELYASYNTITSQLMGQIGDLMAELTLSDTASNSTSSRKRHRSESPSSSYLEVPSPGVSKKRRVQSDSGNLSVAQYQARMLDASHNQSPYQATQVMTTGSPPTVDMPPFASVSVSRKRRSSEADCSSSLPPSKKLRCGPRLHAVSDSFAPTTTPRPTSHLSPRVIAPLPRASDSITHPPLDFKNTPAPQDVISNVTLPTLPAFDLWPDDEGSDIQDLDVFLQSLLAASDASHETRALDPPSPHTPLPDLSPDVSATSSPRVVTIPTPDLVPLAPLTDEITCRLLEGGPSYGSSTITANLEDAPSAFPQKPSSKLDNLQWDLFADVAMTSLSTESPITSSDWSSLFDHDDSQDWLIPPQRGTAPFAWDSSSESGDDFDGRYLSSLCHPDSSKGIDSTSITLKSSIAPLFACHFPTGGSA